MNWVWIMKKYSILLVLLFFSLFFQMSHAQYWFQSGAEGNSGTTLNQGGSVQIQTIAPQSAIYGSLAYWIGETLSNGAFIQVGYEVPNESGYLPSFCDIKSCTGSVFLNASEPAWFWEYFPTGSSENSFYGGIGDDGSVGTNGTFNTYSFNASGDTWSIYINGNKLGSVNLGTSSSGSNPILAIAEYADTNSNQYIMPNVEFKDLEFYSGGTYRLAPEGYSTIGYGKGSDRQSPNPYGVKEISNYINYFETGSYLSTSDAAQLWKLGYQLDVFSRYGGINNSVNYTPFTTGQISAPEYVNITTTKRVIFAGWLGSGDGSYTGLSNIAQVEINSNITENAQWKLQYYINASTEYGTVGGAGWQNANQTTNVSLSSGLISLGPGKRASFEGWANGDKSVSFTLFVSSPANVTAAWTPQYLVNATSEYGSVSGNGWHNQNSTVIISANITTVNQTPQGRTEFERWSNGANQSTINIMVNQPISITAIYKPQYFVSLSAADAYGNPIDAQYFDVNGNRTVQGLYVFSDRNYKVSSAYYKGVNVSAELNLSGVTAPTTAKVILPVYNITIGAYALFNTPLNASLNLTFWNKTNVVTYLGSNGTKKFVDVPYGYAYGSESFIGETKSISVSHGGMSSPTFITVAVIEATFGALILIFILERLYFKEKRAELKKKRLKSTAKRRK
jgi:hypothetical protein